MNDKVLCIIPARGGSKGIKLKNLQMIDGKTLLEITINQATSSGIFDTIHVSTDSNDIKEESERVGLEVPFLRSEENSMDDAHVSKVVLEVIRKYIELDFKFKYVCMLMPTSPLRNKENIVEAFEALRDKKAESLVSVSELGKLETNLRYIEEDGKLQYFNNSISRDVNRQTQNKLYFVNGAIFMSKIDKFLRYKSFHSENVYSYVMDAQQSVDINTYFDLDMAKYFNKYNKI